MRTVSILWLGLKELLASLEMISILAYLLTAVCLTVPVVAFCQPNLHIAFSATFFETSISGPFDHSKNFIKSKTLNQRECSRILGKCRLL